MELILSANRWRCILHYKWNLQSVELTNLYIYMSNELNLIWRVQYSLGSTMALTECILTEDLAWSCLLIAELADRPSDFPAWWVAKVAPECSKYTIPLYSMALEEILGHVLKDLVLWKSRGDISSPPCGEFSKLSCQSWLLGQYWKIYSQ